MIITLAVKEKQCSVITFGTPLVDKDRQIIKGKIVVRFLLVSFNLCSKCIQSYHWGGWKNQKIILTHISLTTFC